MSAPGGEVELRWWTDPRDRARGAIRWRGIDAAGPWLSAPVAWTGQASEEGDAFDLRDQTPLVIELARDHAIVDYDAMQAVVRSPGGVRVVRVVRVVRDTQTYLVATADGPRALKLSPESEAALLPLDGPADERPRPVLWFSQEALTRNLTWELEPRHPRRHDAPAFDAYAVAGTYAARSFVARRGAVAGVLTVADPARREGIFHALGGDVAPVAVPLPARATPRVCAGPPAADALTFTHRTRAAASWGLAGERTALSFTLDLDAQGLCLRRVEGVDARAGVQVEARADGGLDGWITEGGRQRELRCAP